MNFKTENCYIKAKELRKLINESVNASAFEDTYLRDKLLKLSRQIPMQIGMSFQTDSYENIVFHLDKAAKKIRELQIVVDWCSAENFIIDSEKLDYLLEEIPELIQITAEDAELNEDNWLREIMQEFMMDDKPPLPF